MRSADHRADRVADRFPAQAGRVDEPAQRDANLAWRPLLIAACCAFVSGCSTVAAITEPVRNFAASVMAPSAAASAPADAAPAAAAAPVLSPAERAALTLSPAERAAIAARSALPTPSSSAAAPLPTPSRSDPEAPVSPAIQRAYEDARRALRDGKSADAERGFRALAQSNPDLGGPHANLAVIYRQAGKTKEAVAEAEKAVQLNPKQAIYQNQLGITYRYNGQFAKAREAYEAAIALDPNYPSPYINLGILHDLYLADGKRALELYDKYLAMSPGGDATVSKWVADLRNRKPSAGTTPSAGTSAPVTVSQKEKP